MRETLTSDWEGLVQLNTIEDSGHVSLGLLQLGRLCVRGHLRRSKSSDVLGEYPRNRKPEVLGTEVGPHWTEA